MKKSLLLLLIIISIFGCIKKEQATLEQKDESKPYYAHLNQAVQKTLRFHDPSGNFDKTLIKCQIRSTLPNDANVLKSMVSFHTIDSEFSVTREVGGKETVFKIPVPESVTDSITIARSHMFQNYYRYMLGGANVLADSGAIIHEQIKDTLFNGNACKEVFVQYKPIGETPNWYFIIDEKSGEMLQSRFIYNEGLENQRGEFINYGPYVDYMGIKLTSQLDWYYLDGKALATEKIEYLP